MKLIKLTGNSGQNLSINIDKIDCFYPNYENPDYTTIFINGKEFLTLNNYQTVLRKIQE